MCVLLECPICDFQDTHFLSNFSGSGLASIIGSLPPTGYDCCDSMSQNLSFIAELKILMKCPGVFNNQMSSSMHTYSFLLIGCIHLSCVLYHVSSCQCRTGLLILSFVAACSRYFKFPRLTLVFFPSQVFPWRPAHCNFFPQNVLQGPSLACILDTFSK